MEKKLGRVRASALIWAFLRHGILAGIGMIPSFPSDQSHSRQPTHKSELMISLYGILFFAAK